MKRQSHTRVSRAIRLGELRRDLGLTGRQVENVVSAARRRKEPPNLSGQRMWRNYSGISFVNEFESRAGPHNAEILGADFRGANLTGCDFGAADLASANLCFANLVSAELQSTKVGGADFTGARFGQTAIGGVDLSRALGLDQTVHSSPSPVGADTLRLTAAGLSNLPEHTRQSVLRFLSYAGLDSDILAVFRSWIGNPVEFYSVFLSHSSLDKEFARKLYADLVAIGVNCWFDEKQILPGDNILELVDRGVKVWEKFILICSRSSLSPKTGWWVEQELERAFTKERELRRSGSHVDSVLIPITIDDFVFEKWASRFRAAVLDKHVGDFRSWQDPTRYSEAIDKLRRAIDLAHGRE